MTRHTTLSFLSIGIVTDITVFECYGARASVVPLTLLDMSFSLGYEGLIF
jgi:hypothetical protein